jgi:hypothetical protein
LKNKYGTFRPNDKALVQALHLPLLMMKRQELVLAKLVIMTRTSMEEEASEALAAMTPLSRPLMMLM